MNNRVKSPNVESKVARYIKYGQIDLKTEAPKLTAAVYLRNLRTAQPAEKPTHDKNQSERKQSKPTREVFNRLAQPKVMNSVQLVKRKQTELVKPALLQSQVITRQPSKETVTQSKVFNVKNKTLKLAKSKSPPGHLKPNLMSDNVSVQSKSSQIPHVMPRKPSQSRLHSSRAPRPQSPASSGLKSPTPIKKPSMFAKTKRAAGEKAKPPLTERGRAHSVYKNPPEKALSSKPQTTGESTKSSIEVQKPQQTISVQITTDQQKLKKSRSPIPPVRPGSARPPQSNRAKPPPTPVKLPTTPLKTLTLTPTERRLETQSAATLRIPRPASQTSRKKRKPSEPPKLSAEEQLRMLRESVLTELDKDDGLPYVIDIARPTRSANLMIKELNRTLKVLRSDGLFKSINWVDGIDYDSQFAEIVLPMIDQIVTNHQGDFMNPNQQVSLAKPLEAKGFKSYSDKTLLKSIDKIYGSLYGKRASTYMNKLLSQVQESLQSIQVYSNDLEGCPFAKEFCMAIMFYLGHFEGEESEEQRPTEMEVEQTAAHVLALTQQTQNFKSWLHGEHQNCLDTCKKELKEVTWWINRALLSGVRKFHGKCTRKVQITGNKELAYYQVGKVFRFQNIVSANIDGKGDPSQYDQNANVHFHIYSQGGGRCVQQFLGAGSGVESVTGHTILFPSGCEFLICKREEDNDQEVTHIYLREVSIGLSKQSALIVDEEVYWPKYNSFHKQIREAKIDDRGSQVPTLVFKQQSQLAKAYFQSKLFEKALTICDTFKIIQSLERKNEDCLVWNTDGQADRKLAGARLLDELATVTERLQPELKKKMEVAIFCPETTLEEVEQTFKQYKEGGDLILSQNDWRDSNVKVLRSMKSLAEFVGLHTDQQAPGDLEQGKSDKPKRPNLLT